MIKDVKIFKLENAGKMVGFASCTVFDCLKLTGLKIFQGSNGLFVGMPSRQDKDGNYQDIFFPITKEFRHQLHETILNEFDKPSEKQIQSGYNQTDELPF